MNYITALLALLGMLAQVFVLFLILTVIGDHYRKKTGNFKNS